MVQAMTNEEKALIYIRKINNDPSCIPDEFIKTTFQYQRYLAYLNLQDVKLELHDSMPKWIKFFWRIDHEK